MYNKVYYNKHKEKINERRRELYIKNKTKIKEYRLKYRNNNREKVSKWAERYRKKNPDYIKKYWQKNKDVLKEKNKEYKRRNKEQIRLIKKRYREKNKILIKQKKNQYYLKNKEKITAKLKEDYHKNPGLFKKRKKAFLKKNPEWGKRHYNKNRVRLLEQQKIYRKLNPDKLKRYNLNYKPKRKVIDAIRYEKYKELENKRREDLGLPLIGENYKAEKEMKKYLNRLFKNEVFKDNGRYSWLRGMELDRYYPRLRLAFEYQGEQHFEDKKFFKINLKGIQKRDEIKREICNNRSIILVEISYREKLSEHLILAKLKEKGSVTNQRAL